MPSRFAKALDSSRSCRYFHDRSDEATQPGGDDEPQPYAELARPGLHPGWLTETILSPFAKTNQAQRQERATLLLSKCRSYRKPIFGWEPRHENRAAVG